MKIDWLPVVTDSIESQRHKERKRQREEETKRQRVKERKRRREEESKRQRVKKSKGQRDIESKRGRDGGSDELPHLLFPFLVLRSLRL